VAPEGCEHPLRRAAQSGAEVLGREEEPIMRPRAVDAANRKFRYGEFRKGRRACEFCCVTPKRLTGLTASHIVPVGWGGSLGDENLVLLCHRHAVMSDRVGRTLSARAKRRGAYRGPRTRKELFAALRLVEHEERVARKRYWRMSATAEIVMVGEEFFFPKVRMIGGRRMWVIPYTLRLKRAVGRERISR